MVEAGALSRIALFDATDPHTPLGLLLAGDQGGFGLVASPKSVGLIALPIAGVGANRLETQVRAVLGRRGNLTAAVEEVSTGSIGVALHAARANLRNERFTPVLEHRLRETLSFLESLHWKDTWDATAARWRLELDFQAPRYARRTGDSLMMINPQIVAARSRLTPWKTRPEGVVWSGANTQCKQVRLTLPEGAVLEELPDNWSQSIKSATGRLRYRREGMDVICDFELTQHGGFLDQPAYEALRLFSQKAQEAERRPVLILIGEASETTAKK